MPGPHSRGAAVAAPPPAPGRGRPPAGGTSPMQSPMTSSFSVLSAWFRHTRNASASRCTACTAILPSPPACPRPAHLGARTNSSGARGPSQPIGAGSAGTSGATRRKGRAAHGSGSGSAGVPAGSARRPMPAAGRRRAAGPGLNGAARPGPA